MPSLNNYSICRHVLFARLVYLHTGAGTCKKGPGLNLGPPSNPKQGALKQDKPDIAGGDRTPISALSTGRSL